MSSCIVDIGEGIKAAAAGESAYSVAVKASGADDQAVDAANRMYQLNSDMGVVFSDAPLEKRIPAAIDVGLTATTTAAAIVGTVQAGAAIVKYTNVAHPTYYRYASMAEVESTQDSGGFIRGGRAGPNYFTQDYYSNATSAQRNLALGNTPEVRIGFTIDNPPPDMLGPSVVKPANGQPGLGIEFWNFGPFKINISEVTNLKH